MLLLIFLFILAIYVFSYVHAIKQRFQNTWARRAVLWSGAVLLLPMSLGIGWYIMIKDWPMNIGGKPNWTLYHNIPAADPDSAAEWILEHPKPAAWTAITTLLFLLVSNVYAWFRVLFRSR